MVEIFVLKSEQRVFRYLLPDDRTIDEDNDGIDLAPLKEFTDYEAKIVYFPTTLVENTSKGEVEIEIWDCLEDAINEKLFLK
jgi:hypothetical protein